MLNLDGSVSYIFLIFRWFWFLIFPISYGHRFLNFSNNFFKKQKHIFIQKNLDFFTIFTHYNIAIVWFKCIFLNYQPFGIFLKNTNVFYKQCYSFLSCWWKNRFLFWKIQWVVVSYDCRIWWVVSYKTVSYRKILRV